MYEGSWSLFTKSRYLLNRGLLDRGSGVLILHQYIHISFSIRIGQYEKLYISFLPTGGREFFGHTLSHERFFHHNIREHPAKIIPDIRVIF